LPVFVESYFFFAIFFAGAFLAAFFADDFLAAFLAGDFLAAFFAAFLTAKGIPRLLVDFLLLALFLLPAAFAAFLPLFAPLLLFFAADFVGNGRLRRSLFGWGFRGWWHAHRRRSEQLGSQRRGGDDDAYFFFLFIIFEAVFNLIRVLVRLGFKLIISVCVQLEFVLHSYASKALIATDSDRREPLSIILACGADYSNSMQRDANERK
jgi:hypothetical protein